MEIGGGFGGKIPVYMEPMAAIMSKKTGSAREDADDPPGGPRPPPARPPPRGCAAKIGAKRDGTLVAAEAELAFEAGAFPGSPVGGRRGLHVRLVRHPQPAHVEGVGRRRRTSRRSPPTARPARRRPRSPIETLMTELAERLEMRRDGAPAHCRTSPERGHAPHGRHSRSAVVGNIGGHGGRDHAERRTTAPSCRARTAAAASRWATGATRHGDERLANGSTQDGTVSLVVGTVDIGGLRATHAMQLAEALGLTYDDVHPQVVDTDSVGRDARSPAAAAARSPAAGRCTRRRWTSAASSRRAPRRSGSVDARRRLLRRRRRRPRPRRATTATSAVLHVQASWRAALR